MANKKKQYWNLMLKSDEMTQELDNGLRMIRMTVANGDAVCAVYWELMIRGIPVGGVFRAPASAGQNKDAYIAMLIGRSLNETEEILRVLCEHDYLIPFDEGYVMPMVVKNLGRASTSDARHKQEIRWAASGEERLQEVMRAISYEKEAESFDALFQIARKFEEASKKMDCNERLIAAALFSTSRTDSRWETITHLLQEFCRRQREDDRETR